MMDDLFAKGGVEDLEGLESYLDSLLVPVAPRPDFVQALEGRLAEGNGRTGRQLAWYTLFGLLGLFGSLILLIGGRRALLRYLESTGRVRRRTGKVAAEGFRV